MVTRGADSAGPPTSGYTVDEAGNVTREVVTVDGTVRKTVDYTHTANQLQAITVDEPAHGTDPQRTTDTTLGYNTLGDETVRDTSVDVIAPGVVVVDRHTERGYDPAGYTDTINRTVTGELNSDVDIDYTYDLTDRPLTRQATGNGADEHTAGTRIYFHIGATNIRIEATDGTGDTTTTFLVDDRLNPIAQQTYETDGNGDAVTAGEVDWIWLIDDTHGNTATLLDDDGTIVETNGYDPYGAPDDGGSSRLQNPDGNPLTDDWIPTSSLGFQTAPQDADTGNVILGPRQYDPTTRHFTTSDRYLPASMDAALRVDPLTGNQYIFAAANPVAHHDNGHKYIAGGGGGCYGDCPTDSTRSEEDAARHGYVHGAGSTERNAPLHRAVAFGYTFERMGQQPPSPPVVNSIAIAMGRWSQQFDRAALVSGGVAGGLVAGGNPAGLVMADIGVAAEVTAAMTSLGEAAIGGLLGQGPEFRRLSAQRGMRRFGEQAAKGTVAGGFRQGARLVIETGGSVPRWIQAVLEAL